MYHHRNLHLKQIVAVILILGFLFLSGNFLKDAGLSSITNFMTSHRILGIAIYMGYVIISTIIIAIPVVPVWPVALYLYGFWPGVIFTMVGTIIGASVCFLIARKYGKPTVSKMMGKHLYKEVESLVSIDNPRTFFLVRLFGNNYFDTISYIAGLSKLTYRAYIIITGFISTCWIIGLFYLIQKAGGVENIKSFLTIMTGYGLLVLTGTLSWEIYHKRHLKLKNQNRNKSLKRK